MVINLLIYIKNIFKKRETTLKEKFILADDLARFYAEKYETMLDVTTNYNEKEKLILIYNFLESRKEHYFEMMENKQ